MKRALITLLFIAVLIPSFASATRNNFNTQTYSPPTYNSLILTIGSTGASVVTLQTFLRSTGDFTYPTITSYFGRVTAKAVQSYQCSLNIVCSGTPATTGYGQVGPSTRRAITEKRGLATQSIISITQPTTPQSPTATAGLTLSRNLWLGLYGEDVSRLQLFLRSIGDFTYPTITGYYGQVTENAVKRYQRRMNIISYGTSLSTGYGVVGPMTRKALTSSNNAATISVVQTPISTPVTTSSPTSVITPTTGRGGGALTPTPIPTYQSCTFNNQTVPNGNSISAYQSSSVPYGQTCQRETRTCRDGVFSGTYTSTACTVQQPAITYAWKISNWSACTNIAQSRNVTCTGSDNNTYADNKCTTIKPYISKSCTLPQPTTSIPVSQFSWGMNMPYYFTESDLRKLRDGLKINTIRFFVTPEEVGLPQKTYNGPESIDYRKFTDTDYNWKWLDSKLTAAKKVGIMPVLLPFPVDEYVSRMYATDLTSLNNPSKGLDYTGLVPEEQVTAFSVAIAKHVASVFPNLTFSIIYTELLGRGDGAHARTKEAPAWSRIVSAIKKAAPHAEVFSPEMLASQYWNSTVGKYGCENYSSIYYGKGWPLTDTVRNYANSFDNPAISFYGITQSDASTLCPKYSRIRLTLDTVVKIIRENVLGKRFLWAEVGWGNDDDPSSCSVNNMNLNWASFLLGGDNLKGILLWQGKQLSTWKCAALDTHGKPTKNFDSLKKISQVIADNYNFFATYHTLYNNDDLPVTDLTFSETDPATFTRKIGNYIIIYPTTGSYPSITFVNTKGKLASEYLNTTNKPLYIGALPNGNMVVQPLVPNRLYILKTAK